MAAASEMHKTRKENYLENAEIVARGKQTTCTLMKTDYHPVLNLH